MMNFYKNVSGSIFWWLIQGSPYGWIGGAMSNEISYIRHHSNTPDRSIASSGKGGFCPVKKDIPA